MGYPVVTIKLVLSANRPHAMRGQVSSSKVAGFNAAGVAAIPDRDCKALADRLQSAVADFVAAVRTTPGDPEVAWHAGIQLSGAKSWKHAITAWR